jgi:hypothetical protein
MARKSKKAVMRMHDFVAGDCGHERRRESLVADRRLVRPQGVKKYLAHWGHVAFWQKTPGI